LSIRIAGKIGDGTGTSPAANQGTAPGGRRVRRRRLGLSADERDTFPRPVPGEAPALNGGLRRAVSSQAAATRTAHGRPVTIPCLRGRASPAKGTSRQRDCGRLDGPARQLPTATTRFVVESEWLRWSALAFLRMRT